MVALKRLLILALLILSFKAECKEFSNIDDYIKTFPTCKLNGLDGNWLKADREKESEIWNQANKINIKKPNGYLEYQDIYQRCDFYKWFELKTDSLGFETRWAQAAKETTSKLKKLLTSIAIASGNSNKEIEEFVNTGNGIIFDDIWKDLKTLYEHQPLKGLDAEIWDGHLLLKEQNLIDPYYRKLSKTSLKKLQKSLRRETAFSKMLPGFEFDGNLLSIRDRWFYGMKMMHYQNPDINR